MSSGRGHQPSDHDPAAKTDIEATEKWKARHEPKLDPTGYGPMGYNPHALADGRRSPEWSKEFKKPKQASLISKYNPKLNHANTHSHARSYSRTVNPDTCFSSHGK
jgi:hypothetical protein